MIKKIALVFPIYNNLKYTEKSISNIYNCFNAKATDKLPIEIIITDDGSTDGSYQWIKSNYPNINLLKGNGSLWWSGGTNKAVQFAINNLNIDYILLWNNDIKADTKYFKHLSRIIEGTESDSIICSKIYSLEFPDKIISMGGIFNPYTGQYCLRGFGETDSKDYNKIFTADWFGGMGTTIPRKVFDTIGYFNEKKFPQYHGDSDFSLRARNAGIKIYVYPDLKIWNDRKNTGFSNNESFRIFIKSLFTLKSNFNISREFIFYKSHARSIKAMRGFLRKYLKHIGGYIKWKILGIFGLKRNSSSNI